MTRKACPVNNRQPLKKTINRLFSLYPEQIDKLNFLARKEKMSNSGYLRFLIDREYAQREEERLEKSKERLQENE